MQAALISLRADHAPFSFGKPGLPVGGKAHHLVLVTVLWEAEKLRERGIENAQRMREGDGTSHLYLISLPHAPHPAAEITEAVNGDDGGLLKGRREERAGQVGPVMLDEVHLARLAWHNSLCCEHLAHLRDAYAVGGTGGQVQPLLRPHHR